MFLNSQVLIPLQAVTGNLTGSAVNVPDAADIIVAKVNITANSGTATVFRIYLEGSDNGGDWYPLPAAQIGDDPGGAGSAAPGAVVQRRDIVQTTAIVAASKYTAVFWSVFKFIRAQVVLTAGASPSETLQVEAAFRSQGRG